MAIVNARIVLPDAVIDRGALIVEDGLIADVGEAARPLPAIDFDGDWLLPGLVELHTDNLERHLEPRPGVRWDPASAVAAHDCELAGSGILSALDSVSIGDTVSDGFRAGLANPSIDALSEAITRGTLRASHAFHLRCELTDPVAATLFERYADLPHVRLVSLMDHTPGQRQWRDLDRFREQYAAKHGLDRVALDRLIRDRQASQAAVAPRNRRTIVRAARERNLTLASHDDEHEAHVAEARASGIAICEFPTTEVAARAAAAAGQRIVVGAPNILRGGSHSGNVAAATLIAAGCAHILSSDYYPPSLLDAVFRLPAISGLSLPQAVAMATCNPARAVGFTDRGAIRHGCRADLLRVSTHGNRTRLVSAWSGGARVI